MQEGDAVEFVVFFRLKAETVVAAMEHPSDRVAMVNQAVQSLGGRVASYHWMFGPWDGMVIIELPDSAAAAAVSLAVSSSGAFDRVETHELIAAGQVNAVLARAQEVRGAYAPPGAE